jgi:hypothetical protein
MGMTDQEKKEKRKQYLLEYNAVRRERYKNNPQKIDARNKKWRQDNKTTINAINKKWRDTNPEKMSNFRKAWDEKNPDNAKIRSKVWKDKNGELNHTFSSKHRALKLNKLHTEHDFELEKRLYVLARNCEAIFNESFEIDHILPYSCGGWHHHENLQVIPASVNRQKKNNPDFQSNWPNFKTWRDLPEFLLSEKNF